KNKVNFLAIQETKMENMEDLCVRQCWGNLAFDHVHSDAVGNSGGILCVWDPKSFNKSNVTVSDYFVISRGHWRLTDQKMMIIAVYAPPQQRYAIEILTRFNMLDCNAVVNPIVPGCKLKLEEDGHVDETLFKKLVGSLMYITTTRPDIQFVSLWHS
nr:RNA-directed DNA polymerase, eukaryota [Tanacetum cinerariifolium]